MKNWKANRNENFSIEELESLLNSLDTSRFEKAIQLDLPDALKLRDQRKQIGKLMAQVDDLKEKLKHSKYKSEYLDRDLKRMAEDSKMAVAHIEKVEKEVKTLEDRIEELNNFDRADILDLEE